MDDSRRTTLHNRCHLQKVPHGAYTPSGDSLPPVLLQEPDTLTAHTTSQPRTSPLPPPDNAVVTMLQELQHSDILDARHFPHTSPNPSPTAPLRCSTCARKAPVKLLDYDLTKLLSLFLLLSFIYTHINKICCVLRKGCV